MNQVNTPLSEMTSAQERVMWVYAQATEAEMTAGKDAYVRYNRLLSAMAKSLGIQPEIACGVFAALSPNNDYIGNLRDCRTVLMASKSLSSSPADFKVSTYNNNKQKAWDIARGRTDPLTAIVAPKTRNFFQNLVDPSDPKPVTIDGHIYNVFHGYRRPLKSRDPERRIVHFNKREYQEIAACVRTCAGFAGLIPCEMQAVLWFTWKRLHSILISPQLEFWSRDAEVAGLGYTLFT